MHPIDIFLNTKLLIVIAILGAALLGGCSTVAGKPTPPPEFLMKAPKKFPRVQAGDDAKIKLAEAAEVHNRNTRQIRGLQQYIKASRAE